jgi:tRNA dimethylallyltransferase
MRILTIVGPTAVGKTSLAIEIAERTSGEIISADSRQIYKFLTIGTAKPTDKQRKKIRFHLIDFIYPGDDYSCGQFARDAEAKITEVLKRKQRPIVCGGTGLYIRALFNPLHRLPASDKKIKEELINKLNRYGVEYLYKKLLTIDPEWARRVTPKDKQRILRGLEVHELTGRPLSRLLKRKKRKSKHQALYIGLTIPRDELYKRINVRFEDMIEQGLVDEVKSLLKEGITPGSNALRTIGYHEIVEYLQGNTTLGEAIDKAQRRTRNFAKRQITWFSKIRGLKWYNPDDPTTLDSVIQRLESA